MKQKIRQWLGIDQLEQRTIFVARGLSSLGISNGVSSNETIPVMNVRISKAEIAIKALQEPASIELPDLMLHEICKAQEPLKSTIAELEKSFLDMNRSFSADLKDISERLDMPQRRKPTMRPWNMLRSVAEAGEQFMAIKSKPSA